MTKLFLFSFSVLFFFLAPLVAEAAKPQPGLLLNGEDVGVCGEGRNTTPIEGKYLVGESFCVGGRDGHEAFPLGVTMSQDSRFKAGWEKLLLAAIKAIPQGYVMDLVCTSSKEVVEGCQNALSGKSNACYGGVTEMRCADAQTLIKSAGRMDLLLGGSVVKLNTKDVRQVVFLPRKRAAGQAEKNGWCTDEEVGKTVKLRFAGDHTEKVPDYDRFFVIVEGQIMPEGSTARQVTLTMRTAQTAQKDGVLLPYEEIKTCLMGLRGASSHKEEVKTSTPPVKSTPVVDNPPVKPTPVPGDYVPRTDRERICDDGLDNDGDEDIDCKDSDCQSLYPERCKPKTSKPKSRMTVEVQAELRQGVPPKWAFPGPGKDQLTVGKYTNAMLALGVKIDLGNGWFLIPGAVIGTQTNQYVLPNETVVQGEVHSVVPGVQFTLLKKVKDGIFVGGTVGTFFAKKDLIPYGRGVVRFRLKGDFYLQFGVGVDGYEHPSNGDAVVVPVGTVSIVYSPGGDK